MGFRTRSWGSAAVSITLAALAVVTWAPGPARSHDPQPPGAPAPAPHLHRGHAPEPASRNVPREMQLQGGMQPPHGGVGRVEGTHVHVPVPVEYQWQHVPAAAWTSDRLLARGKEIYAARCAVCHGERGNGDGPAAAGLPVKPPSFRDRKMVDEMAGNYWFWRVSEGGAVEPFRSMGSVMPAWKHELSVEERWAVIAYTHRLSGHDGPHVTSEHPEMLVAGHRPRGPAPPASGASTPGSRTTGSSHDHGGHGHGAGGHGSHRRP